MPDAAAIADAFLAEFAPVLGAVVILSPTSFRFCDRPALDVTAQAPAPPWSWPYTGQGGDEPLIRSIQNELYNRCYAHRLSEPPQADAGPLTDDPAFAQLLAAANAGRERWDPGWVIQQLAPNGQVFVRKGERERAAMPGTFISALAAGMALQPGSPVLLRAPSEAFGVQPGYYFAFGETLDELADQLSLVRLYFHCAAREAARLLGALTSALNRFQVPFQMKTPSAPVLYGRTDAAVLYFGARYIAITLRIVQSVRASVPLRPSVPLFAKPLWPGIAAAVDPGNGESFGIHRCRLTAEGIVQAWREGMQDEPARLAAVQARFAAAGLDLMRPWLGPGSVDPFDLPAEEAPS